MAIILTDCQKIFICTLKLNPRVYTFPSINFNVPLPKYNYIQHFVTWVFFVKLLLFNSKLKPFFFSVISKIKKKQCLRNVSNSGNFK